MCVPSLGGSLSFPCRCWDSCLCRWGFVYTPRIFDFCINIVVLFVESAFESSCPLSWTWMNEWSWRLHVLIKWPKFAVSVTLKHRIEGLCKQRKQTHSDGKYKIDWKNLKCPLVQWFCPDWNIYYLYLLTDCSKILVTPFWLDRLFLSHGDWLCICGDLTWFFSNGRSSTLPALVIDRLTPWDSKPQVPPVIILTSQTPESHLRISGLVGPALKTNSYLSRGFVDERGVCFSIKWQLCSRCYKAWSSKYPKFPICTHIYVYRYACAIFGFSGFHSSIPPTWHLVSNCKL